VSDTVCDAVVIGAGPNGLVAANLLADAGWDVVVLEANDQPGGAVRSAEITAPGFNNDLFSAFYPFAAASPVLSDLHLERQGLRWVHAPSVVAHPMRDAHAAVLSRDLDVTAASLDAFAAGDGDAWRELYATFERVGPELIATLLGPFPPVRAGLPLAMKLGPRGALDFARLALAPVRRLVEETFRGVGGSLLLAGAALHADVSPEGAGSGLLGWLMVSLGQRFGFPVPEGGAQRLTDALVARLDAGGGRVVCGARVNKVTIDGRRATGVRTIDGTRIAVRRAVLADTDAVALYRQLVGDGHSPARLLRGLDRFHRGFGTVKVDWALSGPIPWRDPPVASAGTVHLADSVDELTMTSAQLATGNVPSNPFVLLGQMTTADPTRSPAGTESAWAYAHVPATVKGDLGDDGIEGRWDERETGAFARRIEKRIEAHAPGFGERIIARHVFTPASFEEADANLVRGDIGGGTAQLHQQLVLRPTPGLARPETPIRGLYLASASAHPGGGVHGACGANAARAALAHHRLRLR
jgi:phytoene dehydrogenase-like protein